MKQKLVSMFLAGVTLLGIGLYSATPASALNLWQGCEGATDSKVCASKGKDNVANTAKNLIRKSICQLTLDENSISWDNLQINHISHAFTIDNVIFCQLQTSND